MKARLPTLLLILCAPVWSGGAAQRSRVPADALVVRDAWVRESTVARTSSSGYFTVANRTGRPVALVGVRVAGVGDAQVHSTVEQQGRTVMQRLAAVPIPPHGTIELAPGGTHVMLMDIRRPLRAGTTVQMTLTFDTRQTQTVRAVVRPLDAVSVR